MITFLHLLVLLPLVGFTINVFVPGRSETWLSWSAFAAIGVHFNLSVFFVVLWLFSGAPTLDIKDLVIYQTEGYEFFIDFTFDRIVATYLILGSFLTFLVTLYSRYYLHREKGYKRFFNSLLLFYIGYNLVIFSGNLETLFVGWEILGVSSFLLIAFYRERYLPVKNAVKVFSVYRIGDIGIILAMWLSHHFWHQNITFLQLSNYHLVDLQLQSHTAAGVLISLMILISAAAKSAQLPFTSWLPRAMEGPTPSSAIFYGSLAVHLGVFLLMRTFPFWEHQLSIRILIGLVGLSTTIIATGIARVQSSVKSLIAYASSAQIGLIFIEVAAGFETLALVHFAGNAFLRTYQLLVSPSVVSYLIREQFYTFSPHSKSIEDYFPRWMEYTLYIMCIKEWNLDSMMYRYLWNPMKWAGRKLDFLNSNNVVFYFLPVFALGIALVYFEEYVPASAHHFLPFVFSATALISVLKAFTERTHARMSLLILVMNHFWVALSISFNERFTVDQAFIYLSGIVTSGLLGYLCLLRLKILEGNIDLDRFHGFAYEHPGIAFTFLIACLGLSGFPITATFVGKDLIFTHIREDQALLAFFTALIFVIDGLAIIRIYARIFLGPHSKSVYEMAYRSS